MPTKPCPDCNGGEDLPGRIDPWCSRCAGSGRIENTWPRGRAKLEAEIDTLRAERDRYRQALEEIASGETDFVSLRVRARAALNS